jgi:hypothetical protein
MHEATVGILAGIKDVLGIRPRTPRIICCPGHLKETENYVRLALHFKGERQRARLLEHRRGAMSGRLLCPENGRFHYTPKRCRAAKSLLRPSNCIRWDEVTRDIDGSLKDAEMHRQVKVVDAEPCKRKTGHGTTSAWRVFNFYGEFRVQSALSGTAPAFVATHAASPSANGAGDPGWNPDTHLSSP